MSEKVAECKVLTVEMICDKCHNGIMIPEGYVLTSNPPQYPHKCKNCGYSENYRFQYPYQKVIPLEPLRDATGNEIISDKS